ncbi:hypothetical protein Syun_014352 [Stephania yunnanensis]|uniref:GST C-terminal domain-containing protein n=1 Tax=Stephania yunnanensis TaxID=152371 RepID=A0AAP0P8N6_9MAGN
MKKIEGWNSDIFTMSHIPEKYRLFVSKFVRRVVIARMAESPDIANAYHLKLKEAYEIEEQLKDLDVLTSSEEQLLELLDEVEKQLSEKAYVAGDEYTMADTMLIPVLALIELLELEENTFWLDPE